MLILKSMILFLVAGLCEIGGGYLSLYNYVLAQGKHPGGIEERYLTLKLMISSKKIVPP